MALYVFIPLMVVAGVVIYVLFYFQVTTARAIVRANEAKTTEVATQRIGTQLGTVVSDLNFLVHQPSLQRWFTTNSGDARDDLAREYHAFVDQKGIYDQLRLLDRNGREVVRVNWNNGTSFIVADADLQDKSGRYYVDDILNMRPGQIYVSPFDLNKEQGVVEQPIKPVIRFGAPVFDREGRKRGVLILNFLGARILDEILSISVAGSHEVWLLNSDSNWLLGPKRDVEWSFMYPDRPQQFFARDYPDIWTHITGDGPSSGQIESHGSLFTYARVVLGRDVPSGGGDGSGFVAPSWWLVSYIPPDAYPGQKGTLRLNYILAFLVFTVLLAGASSLAAYHRTRYRRAAASAEVNEAHFRTVADTASDAIVTSDINGDITYFNAAAERIFGYRQRDVLNRPFATLLTEPFQDIFSDSLKSLVAGDEPHTTGQMKEVTGRRKNGQEFPVEMSLSGWKAGTDVYYSAILRDITGRVAEAKRLRGRERYARALLEASPAAKVICRPDGQIAMVNAQTERLFGYSRDALVGHDVEILLPDRHRARHIVERDNYVAAPVVRPMGEGRELFGVRADGSEFSVDISLSPVDTDEGMLVIAAIRDITELKETERQIQDLNRRLTRDNQELAAVNKELEAFSYSVSHDLRAPLRAIDGFSQALEEDYGDVLDGPGKDSLDRVRKAAQRMGQLIDDLLKLSRVTRQDMKPEEVDLSSLAREIADQCRASEPQRTVKIAVGEGLTAHGDPRLLRIALENLVGNAWKFTRDQSSACIEFGSECSDGKTAYFIRDNGVGFDMTYANRLFSAFQRLHDPKDFPGTGIGLATVQRIIHKHGGQIWADAKTGTGATFYFTLK